MVRQEDANTQEQLSRRWRPALMAFFLRRIRNRNDAEDLTQEVFVRMLNNPAGDSHPDGYVFQIAQNILVDRSRRAVVRDRYRQDLAHDLGRELDVLDPHRVAEGREQLTALLAALTELPPKTRTMFILYRLENMSQEAIGAAYGISASAVKQHVARAMALVTARLRDVR